MKKKKKISKTQDVKLGVGWYKPEQWNWDSDTKERWPGGFRRDLVTPL